MYLCISTMYFPIFRHKSSQDAGVNKFYKNHVDAKNYEEEESNDNPQDDVAKMLDDSNPEANELNPHLQDNIAQILDVPEANEDGDNNLALTQQGDILDGSRNTDNEPFNVLNDNEDFPIDRSDQNHPQR